MKRRTLAISFILFIAVCASIAYWVMQLFRPPVREVAAPSQVAKTEVRLDAAAGLFGGRAGAYARASNFQLRGVIVAADAPDSIAILAENSKPARAIRAGSEVVPGIKVQEVHRQYVLLSDGGTIKRVDLPEKAPASAAANVPAAVQPPPPTVVTESPPAQNATPVPNQPPAEPAAPQPGNSPTPAIVPPAGAVAAPAGGTNGAASARRNRSIERKFQ